MFGLLIAVWGAFLFGGCTQEKRHAVLAFLFNGVPPEGQPLVQWEPVEGRPRRPPPPVPAPTPVPKPRVAIKEPYPPGWLQKVLKTLPMDSAGYLRMTQALDKGLIKPSAGIKPKTKPQPIVSIDVKLTPMPVVFSHKVHTAWLGCGNCHPSLFQMKAGADKITMSALYAGKFCGKCHGKVVFPTIGDCGRCHQGMGGTGKAKAINAVPGHITMVRKDQSPALKSIPVAVFPHLPHRILFRCYVCHDAIFKMKRGADVVTMKEINAHKYCGACHNGVTAFVPGFSECDRCHSG
jgi:c(7)-type cytochrome triheme protein